MEHEDTISLVLENGREFHFFLRGANLSLGPLSTPSWQSVTVAEGPDDPTSFLKE